MNALTLENIAAAVLADGVASREDRRNCRRAVSVRRQPGNNHRAAAHRGGVGPHTRLISRRRRLNRRVEYSAVRGPSAVSLVCAVVVAALTTLDAQPASTSSPQPPQSDAHTQAASALPPRDRAARRDPPPPPKPRDPRITQLASDADALPPEFAADALIRIAASPRVTDGAWKSGLLTQAFFTSYSVREAYRRSTPQSIPIDTRQGAQLM